MQKSLDDIEKGMSQDVGRMSMSHKKAAPSFTDEAAFIIAI